MCCESTEAAQLARGKGGEGEEPAFGCSNHIFQAKMTASNRLPLTLTMSHTHCRSSVSQYVDVTVTHCSCSYTCSSILFIAPENEDTGVLLECNDSFTI